MKKSDDKYPNLKDFKFGYPGWTKEKLDEDINGNVGSMFSYFAHSVAGSPRQIRDFIRIMKERGPMSFSYGSQDYYVQWHTRDRILKTMALLEELLGKRKRFDEGYFWSLSQKLCQQDSDKDLLYLGHSLNWHLKNYGKEARERYVKMWGTKRGRGRCR